MSSKILSGHESQAAVPVLWRKAGETNVAMVLTKRPPTVTDNEELQQRIAVLERRLKTETAEAYQKGVREGEAQARGQAQAAVQPLLDKMAAAVRELSEIKPRLRRDAEADVVQLAVAIARRILHRELSVDPSAMQALVRVALGRLERQELYRVWVHPSQAQAVRSGVENQSGSIEVIADPNRELGSLLFETNRGKLDASVSAQFEEIERGLADRVRQK